MKIIDAHVHVFEVLKGFRGEGDLTPIGGGIARWANGQTVKMVPPELGDVNFTIESCYNLLKSKGVEKAVVLQGSFYGIANEYTVAARDLHPDFFLPMGSYDPFCRYADQIYDRLTNELQVTGLKFELSEGGGISSYHRPFDIGEVMEPIAARCEKNNQTLVLDLGSPGMSSMQPESVAALAKRHPGLNIVICHLLAPVLGDEDRLKAGLETLALDNVWFDIAAVPFNVNPEVYPYPTGIKYLSMAKDIVGAKKIVWGTDVPSVLWYDSYEHLLDYFFDANVFTQSELEDVVYNNAVDAYRF